MATLTTLTTKLVADTSGLSKGFTTAKGLAVGLGAALVGIGIKGVKAFDLQAKAVAQVNSALKSTAGAAGFTSTELQKMASSLQKSSLFGDEEILKKVTANLLTFTNVAGDSFSRASQAALDLSTRLGTDLQSSTLLLGKALNDPVKGMTRLSEAGVDLTKEQQNLIISLAATNDIAGAQAIILNELETQFGGAAKAASEAGLGPFQQLQNSLGDLSEIVGKAFLPAIKVVVEIVQDLADKVSSAAGGRGLAKFQAAMVATVKAVQIGIKNFRNLLGPIVAVVKGYEAVALAIEGDFVGAAKKAKEAGSELLKPFNVFRDALGDTKEVIGVYKEALEELSSTTEEVVQPVVKAAKVTSDFGTAQEEVVTRVKLTNKELQEQIELLNRINNVSPAPQITPGTTARPQGNTISSTTAEDPFIAASKEIITTTENVDGLSEAYNNLGAVQQDLLAIGVEGFGQMSDLMIDMIFAGKSIGEVWKALGQSLVGILKDVIKSLVAAVIKALALAAIFALITGKNFGDLFKGILGKQVGIPGLADGGLVTSPTLALVGEAGPELVIPLSQLNNWSNMNVNVTGEVEGNRLKLLMDRQTAIDRRRF